MLRESRAERIIFDIILFLALFIFPWWISAVLTFAGIFLFRKYYEFLAAYLVMYALYSAPEAQLLASPLWFSVILCLTYFGIQAIRTNIIFYKNK